MEIDGQALYEQAMEFVQKGEHLDVALEQLNRLFNETIHGRGDLNVLLFSIASAHMKRQEWAMAIMLFKEAIEQKPDFVLAINNLGYVYKQVQKYIEAAKCFDQVLYLIEKEKLIVPDEDKADFLTNRGSLLIANGTPLEACEYFDKAFELTPDNDSLLWNRSLALLEMGDYEKGFLYYERGQRVNKTVEKNYRKKELPFWDGTPGKSVVVYGEQGIGDELMFASVLPDIIKDCSEVIFDAHPRLIELFRRSFPSVPVFGTRKMVDEAISWSKYYNPDFKIAIGSLGKFYRKAVSDFPREPYIKADPALMDKYASQLAALSARPKIGISWKGGVASTGSNVRHIPLIEWIDLLGLPCDFISLQYTKEAGQDVAMIKEQHGITIHHWQDMIDDYDETAGLVANLDLVISVPQSIVHLAGSMGTAVWQMRPVEALWQMGPSGDEMPWYCCAKNFHQEKTGEWQPVIKQVKEELCDLLQMITKN